MSQFWNRVAAIQTHKKWWVLAVVLLSCIGLGFLGSKLTVAAGFEHLLPDGRDSVVELNRVAKRTAGVSTLFIVIETPPDAEVDRKRMREACDALVVELRKLGEPVVGSADTGVQEALRFFERYGGLYADQAELEKLRADIDEYYTYLVNKEMGTLLDEDEPPPPVPLDPDSVRKRFKLDSGVTDRYPGGYFESADGRAHVITIRSKVLGGDLKNGTAAIAAVRKVVDDAHLEQIQPGLTVGYAGDLYSGVAEVKAINDDVTEVGKIGGLLLAGVVLLYYLRIRTLLIMLLTIVIGLVWTAGAAYLLVHQLNTATGFIFTIIAGTGINTGIIYMARYLEARRKDESVDKAIATAHRETFIATLCAASASSASFFSLQLTAFRGFRELGLVGGVGLLLCWLATLVALPAMLAVAERISPITAPPKGALGRLQSKLEQSFGKPFAFIVERAGKPVAVAGIAIGIAGFIALGFHIAGEPLEYDMNKLRNDPRSRVREERIKKISISITGYVGADGMAILVDDVQQVGPLREALYKKRDAVDPSLKPFSSIVALEDFLPPGDQQAKIPTLLAIKKRVEKAHKRKAISDADWANIERYMPPDDLQPIGLEDIPEGVARIFTEADGTRGRIVYIAPTSTTMTEDARYLLRWAESYRRTELPDKSVVLGSGRAVIYADMWEAVTAAVPVAIVAAFAAVLLVVLVTFRAGKPALLVLGGLLIGIGWMGLGISILDIKLNFLNFVALPLTFGIGVDYAVNVVWRATREGPDGALIAVRETGGAVVLSSLTTTLGYVALISSMNFAVRSLGVVAVLGEISTMVAAMLVLPGVLMWLARRKAAASQNVQSTASTSMPNEGR